jgi:hypothetical protein
MNVPMMPPIRRMTLTNIASSKMWFEEKGVVIKTNQEPKTYTCDPIKKWEPLLVLKNSPKKKKTKYSNCNVHC